MKKFFGVKMDEELIFKLKKLSIDERTTMTNIINKLLKGYVENQKNDSKTHTE